MSPRPTTDVRIALLDTFDDVWAAFTDRLTGIGPDEYLWEPVAGCWSVRRGDDGIARVDGDRRADPDPAPVSTIAWRTWHVAVDCLDSYSSRILGATGATVSGEEWHLDPQAAIDDAERAWRCFRNGVAARSVDEWWVELGDAWGPFARHSLLDLVLHALHEVTHHAAEVALLRDLHRSR